MNCLIKILFLCLALGTSCATRVTPQESPGRSELEIYGFLTPSGDQFYLNLRITNRASKPTTVLTKQPSLFGVGADGRRSPYIGISYRLHTFTSPRGGSWKFVPSLADLAPVTLLKDETATMTLLLERELVEALKQPDAIFSIDYEIDDNIAARFGLWHGKVSLRESVASLLHK